MTVTTETVAPTGATVPVISLRGIVKEFGTQRAVDGLDLDIAQGEFLSLLGPSGCGKTTLLRMIGGFEEPDAGEILLSGSSVVGVPPHRRTVNTVFQAYALFPHMSVAQNVAYGLRQRRTPRAEIAGRVKEALRLVRMEEFAHRPPRKLSGGQQQRVAIARAIVNRPDVLLLDEPLSALDRQLRERMQVELKLLQREVGITFVFVTHDQGEALVMSDRIVVMKSGRIEQVGTPQEVYERPGSAFVASFIGTQNFADATLREGGVVASEATRFAPPAAALASYAVGDGLRVALRAEAVRVSAGEPDQPANKIAGRLVGTSFLGGEIQYVVIGADGKEVFARTPVRDAADVSVGDPVWCSWAPDSVLVFPAGEDR
ncbi:ABC transporter ATP-binding protein [Pimelobacter simplex]|uniref:ABC transporter ATP-binding protein n=1 Tax=Nocardioides simplex TaxID=2045 RepID=UPI0021505314|nr:polyamine ABC transporter ATP-binding protein [Pimelobacter simplex]UUW92362.1 polyamine ABC transporter ATP-binding protein [Pimelobacter simplex]UUW96190.1 polyamine ABC transporter ATP-binding protein [Pimelobacter simplex]